VAVAAALKRRAVEGGSYRVRISLARLSMWLLHFGVFDKSYAASVAGGLGEHEYRAPAAGPSEPADTCAITNGPPTHVGPDGLDRADDLVAGHARILKTRQIAFDNHRITLANATGMNPNQNLTNAGRRERRVRLVRIWRPLGELALQSS
jgi:hypothetical protein